MHGHGCARPRRRTADSSPSGSSPWPASDRRMPLLRWERNEARPRTSTPRLRRCPAPAPPPSRSTPPVRATASGRAAERRPRHRRHRLPLAYRLRRPVGRRPRLRRGHCPVRRRRAVHEVGRILRDDFDTDSLERPALVRCPDGGWRIYLSLATPGTLHWKVVALDADDPAAFDPSTARTVLDAGPDEALKDTVVHPSPDGWEIWVCLHASPTPSRPTP